MPRANDTEKVLQDAPDSSQLDKLWDTVVALQAELDALYAKLDADAGVSDVNYASTLQAMTAVPQKRYA